MRARYVFLFLLFGLGLSSNAQDFSHPGPLPVGTGTAIVSRVDGSTFGALLFHPGTGASPSRGTSPWPVVAFGHGFLAPPALYAQTMRHLASWGFSVIAPQSALEFFPSHSAYGRDLRQCLYWVRDQGRNPASPWFGLVSSNRWGLSGHSMGGGADILAALDEPEVDAVANMGAADTLPSAVDLIPAVQAATCFIAGSDDTIAAPEWQTYPFYRHANAPRLFALLNGGSHCGFVDVPLPGNLCDEARMPRALQLAKSRALLSAFFRLYLHDDEAAWPFVWGPALALDPAFRVQADPGFDIAPAYARRRIHEGETAEFQLCVTNRSIATTRFLLAASGNTQGLALSPAVTEPVPAGASATVVVRVMLPAGSQRTYTVVDVRAEGDGRSRSFAILGLERIRTIRK